MQCKTLGASRVLGLPKLPLTSSSRKNNGWHKTQVFSDVARLLSSSRQALVQASQHLNGGSNSNGAGSGNGEHEGGRVQRMPQPLRAFASQQGQREPSTMKTAVAQVERLESLQASDSMDGYPSDFSDFSSEDEVASTSYGTQERAGGYSYSKSHYEVCWQTVLTPCEHGALSAMDRRNRLALTARTPLQSPDAEHVWALIQPACYRCTPGSSTAPTRIRNQMRT